MIKTVSRISDRDNGNKLTSFYTEHVSNRCDILFGFVNFGTYDMELYRETTGVDVMIISDFTLAEFTDFTSKVIDIVKFADDIVKYFMFVYLDEYMPKEIRNIAVSQFDIDEFIYPRKVDTTGINKSIHQLFNGLTRDEIVSKIYGYINNMKIRGNFVRKV